MKTISVNDFFKIKETEKPTIIDVRSPDEFSACHVYDSLNIPLDKIEEGFQSAIPKDRPVYLLCQSGMRSDRARKILESQGYTNLTCIEGGIVECAKKPGMVEVFSKRLPLMRQVQLAAGFLVTLGIVLARFVHPGFLALSLFVGLGLMFSGATGLCGLAIVLEKLPWNRFNATGQKCL